MKKVYLASPFFNELEMKRMNEVLEILRDKGLTVFAPYEGSKDLTGFGTKEWKEEVFNLDIVNIDTADIVVAVINYGNVDDSGTAFELGYSYATGKPVIVVDYSNNTINLMVAEGLHAHLKGVGELKNYDFDSMLKIEYEGEVF